MKLKQYFFKYFESEERFIRVEDLRELLETALSLEKKALTERKEELRKCSQIRKKVDEGAATTEMIRIGGRKEKLEELLALLEGEKI